MPTSVLDLEVLKKRLKPLIQNAQTKITILTGAGISAESGIPTFRGPEGYWTVGSREYHPQEMATQVMFQQRPYDVWHWYLYRKSVCGNAFPNRGHEAIVEIEKRLSDRFTLITQNVDNLHLRAGNTIKRTLQIHGNVFYMRCAHECSSEIYPIPDHLEVASRDACLPVDAAKELVCPKCGYLSRPHVLWFDEIYNDTHFYFTRALEVASNTDLLIIVGTAGTTNLPNRIVRQVASKQKTIININIQEDSFSQDTSEGLFFKMPSTDALSQLLTLF